MAASQVELIAMPAAHGGGLGYRVAPAAAEADSQADAHAPEGATA